MKQSTGTASVRQRVQVDGLAYPAHAKGRAAPPGPRRLAFIDDRLLDDAAQL